MSPKKAKIILLITFSVLMFSSRVNSQYFQWGKCAGSPTNNEVSNGVTVDANGNAYYTGKFESTALFPNNQNYVSNGQSDIFLSKINSQGNTLWVKTAGGQYIDEGTSVAIDAQGNVYITGYYSQSATFGNQTINAAGNTDIFIAKYNNAGNLSWVISAGGNDSDKAKSIAIDGSGNVYITGSYINSATFGSFTVNCSGLGVFLAKYNSSGTALWARTSTGAASASGNDIAISGNSVYVVGNFFSSITFGAFTLESQNPRPPIQGFAVCYDVNGNVLWGDTQYSGFGQSWFYGCAADASGNLYVAGKFDSNIMWDGLSITSSGQQDALFIKYNSTGAAQWVKAGGSPGGHEGAMDIKVVNSYVYAAGFFSNTSSFGATSVAPNGGNDIFITFLALNNGNFSYAFSDGGYNSNEIPYGIAVTSQTLHVAGVTGPATYGFDTVKTNSSSHDAFIGKTVINQNVRGIAGMVFRDLNNNNVYDANEPFVNNHFINASNSGGFSSNFASNYYGHYIMMLTPNPNPYSLTLPYPLLYHTYTPVNPQILISNPTGIITQDFAYHVIPNMQDLRITVTPTVNFPRPGFSYTYQVTYTNVGTVAVSSNIRMDFDLSKMIYNGSSGGGIYIPSTNYVTWNYSNLQPGETRTVFVTFVINTNTPLGSYVNTTTTVNPLANDQTPYNNTAVTSDRVRGSYDPNDKACSHDTVITPAEISRQDSLVYTIRFQNTGTAEAINIYIADTISPNLDLASLTVISSSHNMEMVSEDNNRIVFAFENIMLPDSNSNEPQSHGFVKYYIKPKNNLTLGTVITNKAYIFFDFNEPVITNATYNIVNNITGINPNGNNEPFKYKLEQNFPNPFNPVTGISFGVQLKGMTRLTVYDVTGREIAVLVNGELEPGNYQYRWDASAYASGIYFYRLESGSFTETKKMMLIK